jgi:hypothetical protein
MIEHPSLRRLTIRVGNSSIQSLAVPQLQKKPPSSMPGKIPAAARPVINPAIGEQARHNDQSQRAINPGTPAARLPASSPPVVRFTLAPVKARSPLGQAIAFGGHLDIEDASKVAAIKRRNVSIGWKIKRKQNDEVIKQGQLALSQRRTPLLVHATPTTAGDYYLQLGLLPGSRVSLKYPDPQSNSVQVYSSGPNPPLQQLSRPLPKPVKTLPKAGGLQMH